MLGVKGLGSGFRCPAFRICVSDFSFGFVAGKEMESSILGFGIRV